MIVKETDLTGETLSNYKIIERLGRGGMATVYKAHELSLNRIVALKVLSTQLSEDEDYIKRFKREAQTAAQLNHPHIIQIYAIAEENGLYYFAMEYIKGKSLADMKRDEKIFSPASIIPIMKQVADALGDAHRAGLVHRDIKPSNIMIDTAGRAKVADFGIAYVSSAKTKLTRDGSIIGTPEYLSPEQCEGKVVDQRSDIYSLGVTLYELLSGRTPYEADTPVSMLMKIVKGEFPPLNEINPSIPGSLQIVVQKMMETDVNKRYQSMDEVIQALDAAAIDIPVSPTIEDFGQRTAMVNNIEATLAVPLETKKGSKMSAITVAAIIILLLGGAFAAKILFLDKKEPTPTENTTSPATNLTQQPTQGQTPGTDTTNTTGNNLTGTQETGTTQPNESTSNLTHNNISPDGQTITSPGIDTPTPTNQGQDVNTNSNQPDHTEPTTNQPNINVQGNTQSNNLSSNNSTSNGVTTRGTSSIGGNITPSNPTHGQTTGNITPRPQPTPKPLPPANSCIISTAGDDDPAGLASPYIEEILSKRNFTVIDGPTVSNRNLRDVARNHLVLDAKQVGSRTLTYHGSSSELYTVRLTLKVIDPATGKILAGPFSKTVEYTSLNAEENFRDAVTSLMSKILPKLH